MVCSLVSIYFDSPKFSVQWKKLYKTLDYWSRGMLNFDFLRKGLGIVSPPHFVYGWSRKMFFVLYSINWPNFLARLSLLLEILVNMCVAIVCLPGWDVNNFEVDLTFPTKSFFYMAKTSRQKFKYLENEKSFKGERKSFFF